MVLRLNKLCPHCDAICTQDVLGNPRCDPCALTFFPTLSTWMSDDIIDHAGVNGDDLGWAIMQTKQFQASLQ